MNRNGNKLILHLINMSGARRQNFGSHIPIAGGSIEVSSSVISSHALVCDKNLEINEGIITLPTIDRFEVVILESTENPT